MRSHGKAARSKAARISQTADKMSRFNFRLFFQLWNAICVLACVERMVRAKRSILWHVTHCETRCVAHPSTALLRLLTRRRQLYIRQLLTRRPQLDIRQSPSASRALMARIVRTTLRALLSLLSLELRLQLALLSGWFAVSDGGICCLRQTRSGQTCF